MNPLNYASLEASKRLVEAGIVLETEAVWRKNRDRRVEPGYYLTRKALYHRKTDIPAPCMAEIWRELPGIITADRFIYYICLNQIDGKTYAHYRRDEIEMPQNGFEADNPTDALISLLIWVRKENNAS